MPDFSKVAKIIVVLAPPLIELGRQYLESRPRTQQAPDDTGAAPAGEGPGRAVPPGPPRRPTDAMIDDIRFR